MSCALVSENKTYYKHLLTENFNMPAICLLAEYQQFLYLFSISLELF